MRGKRRSGRSAFSLIELLLVLVILAILAAIVVPKFTGQSERAREAKARADITTLDAALDRFELDAGRYPSNEEGLQALVTVPANVRDWRGPYIKQVPIDPWDKPYIYRFPGQVNANGYDLLSVGSDGNEGTADDVTNFTQAAQ